MIKLGNNNIGKIYLGSNSIGKAYLGSNLVFQKGSSPTPTPYTLVDYIETDGTAYINTGIKGNAPMSTKITIVPVAPSSGTYYLFGCRKDSGDTRFCLCNITSNKKIGFSYGSGNYIDKIDVSDAVDNATSIVVQTRFKSGEQIIYEKPYGGSSYTNSSGAVSGTITTNADICLFRYNNQGAMSSGLAGVRCSFIEIYDDYDWSHLVFKGVPCYYNGEYGLWDTVSDSFFGNAAGSGAFTGPSI